MLKARATRFKVNAEKLASGFQLKVPQFKTLPPHLKEIFELMRRTLKSEDLQALLDGTHFSEAFLNLYFKILEKMNLLLLCA